MQQIWRAEVRFSFDAIHTVGDDEVHGHTFRVVAGATAASPEHATIIRDEVSRQATYLKKHYLHLKDLNEIKDLGDAEIDDLARWLFRKLSLNVRTLQFVRVDAGDAASTYQES